MVLNAGNVKSLMDARDTINSICEYFAVVAWQTRCWYNKIMLQAGQMALIDLVIYNYPG